ncbi:MAG: hypothetical protein AAGA66_19935 [Bacteroidota bacterium]
MSIIRVRIQELKLFDPFLTKSSYVPALVCVITNKQMMLYEQLKVWFFQLNMPNVSRLLSGSGKAY